MIPLPYRAVNNILIYINSHKKYNKTLKYYKHLSNLFLDTLYKLVAYSIFK